MDSNLIYSAPTEYRYDAFISYRHLKPDQNIARHIHKKLELIKVPGSIRRKNIFIKKRIERVFRDQEELQTAQNLEEPIAEALNESEWLIVIASDTYQESEWCQKEIMTFLQQRGRNNILVVLAQGNPVDVIPKVLWPIELQGKDNISQAEAKTLYDIDVRAGTRLGSYIKINCKLYTLANPILHVFPKKLQAKYRRKRRWKKIRVFTVLAVAVLIHFLFVRLWIGSVHETLEGKYALDDSVIEETIEYKNYASLQALAEDDRDDIVKYSCELLNDYGEERCPQARRALFDTLAPYNTGDDIKIVMKHTTWGKILYTYYCENTGFLLIYDDSLTLTILNPINGEIIETIGDIDPEYFPNASSDGTYFVYINSYGKYKCYDFLKRKYVKFGNMKKYLYGMDNPVYILTNYKINDALNFDDVHYCVLDDDRTVVVLEIKVADDLLICDDFTDFEYDNNAFKLLLGTDGENNHYYIDENGLGIIENRNGEIIGDIPNLIGFDDQNDRVYVKSETGQAYSGPTYTLDELYEKTKCNN